VGWGGRGVKEGRGEGGGEGWRCKEGCLGEMNYEECVGAWRRERRLKEGEGGRADRGRRE